MKRWVDVEFSVEVEVDESKFTPEFMAEFRESFYPFTTIEEHIEHLAQLYVRGIAQPYNDFIEGYGMSDDFGIKFKTIGMNVSL
jgi:hypothetical protein